jgi:hypothetical protein
MLDPRQDPRRDETMQKANRSALIIDAKALFDAAQREHVGRIADKRTGIEVMVLKERMHASGTDWRWVSSERQYSDGLTKASGRQLLADRLRKGTIKIVEDVTYTAAKKKTKEERKEIIDSTRTTRNTTRSRAMQLLVFGASFEKAAAQDLITFYVHGVGVFATTLTTIVGTILVLMMIFMVVSRSSGAMPAISRPAMRDAQTQTDRVEEEAEHTAAEVNDTRETQPLDPTGSTATSTTLMPSTILVTPHGDCYHVNRQCFGLRRASGINTKRPCLICCRG